MLASLLPLFLKIKTFCPSLSWEETLHEDFSLSCYRNEFCWQYTFYFNTNTKKRKKEWMKPVIIFFKEVSRRVSGERYIHIWKLCAVTIRPVSSFAFLRSCDYFLSFFISHNLLVLDLMCCIISRKNNKI